MYHSLLKKFPMVLVLVYADWCGHCTTFKNNIWKHVKNLKKKNVGVLQMNETALPASPVSGAKINGYPSLLLIGKDGKPAEFKDERTGEATNAMPNSNNLPLLKSIVSGPASAAALTATATTVNASPSTTYAEPPNDPNVTSGEPQEDTPDLTPEAEEVRQNASGATLDALGSTEANGSLPLESVAPPNISEDLLESQGPEEFNTTASSPASGPASGPVNSSQLGGSLYASMLTAAKTIAPAVILTTAATSLSRKRRTKRSKKLSRRRR